MRPFYGTSVSIGAVTFALLTGCSGGGNFGPSGVGPESQQAAAGSRIASGLSVLRGLLPPRMLAHGGGGPVHPFINFAALAKNKGDTIAISDNGHSVVYLYTAAGMHVGTLTGFKGPEGIASDIKGDLYVTDLGKSRVQVYAAGFAKPPTILSVPGMHPNDVDSFSNGAYVAVANYDTVGGDQGTVSIFKGSKLQNTIKSETLYNPYSCAFDAIGNLYVDGTDRHDVPIIGEIANATSGGTTFEQLTTANRIGLPRGIQVTTSGQIAILDVDSLAIYSYAAPSEGSLGIPTQTTALTGAQIPLTFAFTKNMASLYATDVNASVSMEYAYPAGGSPVLKFNVGDSPYGTAIIPTQFPKKKT